MVRAGHTPWQPLQNLPSRHLGWWATPWSAGDMLNGQHPWVDIPALARAANKGLAEKTERGSLLNCPSYPPPPHSPSWSRDLTVFCWALGAKKIRSVTTKVLEHSGSMPQFFFMVLLSILLTVYTRTGKKSTQKKEKWNIFWRLHCKIVG